MSLQDSGANKKFIVAICGASGTIYGLRLLKALLARPFQVLLMISDSGRKVLEHENQYKGEDFDQFLIHQGISIHKEASFKIFDEKNLYAPPASGSFKHHGMIIAPCSMKTLGAIASGISDNLIHRAADVSLKERRPLILLPRETPFSIIHLKNMAESAMAGATIMPPSPSFYSHPKSITELVDTVVARVLDHLDIEHDLVEPWGDQTPL